MWEMLLPSLISAGANIFGGMQSAQGAQANNASQMQMAQMNMNMQRETNAQQYQMFQENQDWQAKMSNTAYQRQMFDMRQAGLNPILAYQKGGGASTPATSPPSLTAPSLKADLENPQGELGRGISGAATSAMNAMEKYASVQNALETNKLTEAQTKKTTADTNLSANQALQVLSQTKLTDEQVKQMPWLRDLLKAQTTAAEAAAGASGAAAGASTASAGLSSAQTDQVKKSFGEGIIGRNAGSIWDIFKQAIPTPQASTAKKTANIPGARSLWDIIKEKMP